MNMRLQNYMALRRVNSHLSSRTGNNQPPDIRMRRQPIQMGRTTKLLTQNLNTSYSKRHAHRARAPCAASWRIPQRKVQQLRRQVSTAITANAHSCRSIYQLSRTRAHSERIPRTTRCKRAPCTSTQNHLHMIARLQRGLVLGIKFVISISEIYRETYLLF